MGLKKALKMKEKIELALLRRIRVPETSLMVCLLNTGHDRGQSRAAAGDNLKPVKAIRFLHFLEQLYLVLLYATEIQVYSPPISLPMDTDNSFEKSEWIGQQRSWVISPPVLKQIAQLLEFPLPLENTAPVTTDQPAQFFSINVPDIGDEVLMLRMRETDPTSEAADHGNGDDPYQGADVYDACDIPLAVVSDYLSSGSSQARPSEYF
ncbi:hypothetical protein DFH08DRAFT_818900 [Mycena albidolilacea]|uniref:Uncharacterized protein n=1 Tax=Mycena albidolilacea TaxID=1033008 RepID=A0AAD6ZFV8_9AGAR|nr:hypothetical protein DFH08DRAFT_818900 [Mycena albidolilacea]